MKIFWRWLYYNKPKHVAVFENKDIGFNYKQFCWI